MIFKLTYHSNSMSDSVFSKLFEVPPKLEFGLPTQFSCPMDALVFLNSSLDIIGITYKSSCLNLNLGLFSFENLENTMYVFEECDNAYCNNINFTNTANIVIWSYFPELVTEVDMGYFVKLLPATPTNNSALVATFSNENYEVIAELFNVQISLFDTVVNTRALISSGEVNAIFSIELYGKYLTETTLTMQQTTKNRASIVIQGRFLDDTNNIPSILERFITERLHSLYTRALIRVRNAEIVNNKSLSQQVSATEYLNKMTNIKSLTDALFQSASEKLNDQEKLVRNISDDLSIANEEVQELQNMMNNVCKFQKCEKICIPREKCQQCLNAVKAPYQEKCQRTQKFPKLISVISYYTDFRFEYKWKRFCAFKSVCKWKLCKKLTICAHLPTITLVKYRKLKFLSKVIYPVKIITFPCILNMATVPLVTKCCALVGCEMHKEDDTCANKNKQCHTTKKKIYGTLSNEQAITAELLQRSDRENEKEASLRLELAQLTVRKSNTDRRVAEGQESLADANKAVELTSASYSKIRNATNLDQLQRLRAKRDATSSQFNTIKITSVSFNTTIVSESPTVLILNVTGNIDHVGYNFSQELVVDFARLHISLRRAAIKITENLIINDLDHSKKSLRYRHQTSETGDNSLLFQDKCADLHNLNEYIKIINQSLQTLENVTTTSISITVKGRNDLNNLIAEYTKLYSKPITIDAEKINHAFNYTINITTTEEIEGTLSDEETQTLNLLKEHLNASANIDEDIGKSVFTKWQNKMEELHNKTSSAAGHECDGFSDCLQKIIAVLEDILFDTPSSISDRFFQQIATASQDLLELALIDNSSLQSAIQKPKQFFNIINNAELNEYWCATLPVIIKQPAQRITPHENTTAILFCEALSDNYTSYKWKNNGNELLHQKNSTLVLKNVQLRDSGNYTCEITNQVGTVISTIASVEVQRFPQFFLQPKNVDTYIGEVNGARFTSNATGWPYPGYRWYFRFKNSKNFTQLPDEVGNEYIIPTPQPHHEGSYYCEAFNEQGAIKSNIVTLTILGVSGLQLSQSFSVSFNSIFLSNYDGSGSGNQNIYSGDSLLETSGSGNFSSSSNGRIDSSGSFDNPSSGNLNSDDTSGSGISTNISMKVKLTKTDIQFENLVKKTIISATDFISSTLENISVSNIENNTLSITFTVFSNNLSYPNNFSDDFIQTSAQMRVDWFIVIEKLKKMLTESSIVISFGNIIYNSESNSTIIWPSQYICPPGKQISPNNNFICSELLYM